MTLGTGQHGAIIEFLNYQFREEIKRQQLPWTVKSMMVGVRWQSLSCGESPQS